MSLCMWCDVCICILCTRDVCVCVCVCVYVCEGWECVCVCVCAREGWSSVHVLTSLPWEPWLPLRSANTYSRTPGSSCALSADTSLHIIYKHTHKHTQSVAQSSSTCMYMYIRLYTIIILHNTVHVYRAGNFGEILDLVIWWIQWRLPN